MPIQEGEDLISIANRLMANPSWSGADLYYALLEAFRLGMRSERELRESLETAR